jgi:hypothetical protein
VDGAHVIVMKIVSVPGVVIALLLSAPALMTAWSSDSVDLVPVMLMFVLTALAASFGIKGLQTLISGYRRSAVARAHVRKRQEHADRLEAERERRMSAAQ